MPAGMFPITLYKCTLFRLLSCTTALLLIVLLVVPIPVDAVYTVGMINTWTIAQGKVYFDAFRDGAVAAVQHQNNNGKIRGEDLQLAFGNIDVATDTSAFPVVNNISSTYGDSLVCFAVTALDYILAWVVPAISNKQYTLVGAIGRDSTLRSSFSKYIAHLMPSPEAELLTQIDYVVRKLRVRRVAMIISIYNDDPLEQTAMYPVYLLMKAKLAEYGINETSIAIIESRLIPTNYSLGAEVTTLLAKKPQAVFYCAPPTPLGAQMLALLLRLGSPQLYFGLFAAHGSLIEQVLATVGNTVEIGNRITATMPLPLYSSSNPIAKAFRAEMAAASGIGLDVTANVGFRGQFAFLSWVHLKLTIAVMRSIDPDIPINKTTFTDAFFNFRIQPINDMFFGMYANDCTTFSGAACQCNQGGKFVWMSMFDATGVPRSIDGILTTIATDDCDAADLIFKNPFIALFIHPPNDNTFLDLRAGALAYSNSNSDAFDLLPYERSFSNATSEADSIRSILADNTITAILNPVSSNSFGDLFPVTNVSTLVLEPVRVYPAPHAFSSQVIRISATLDQEIHVATGFAQSKGTALSIVLPNTISTADAIQKLAQKSSNTYGMEAGPVMRGINLQQALQNNAVTSNIIFVLGAEKDADMEDIVEFLTTNTDISIVLPHEHVILWYGALYNALRGVAQSVQKRLYVTTSFGAWNSTNPEDVEAVFASAQITRSPAALHGFVTQSFASRLLSQLSTTTITSELLEKALYSTTVIAATGNLITGPFSNVICSDSASIENCELNAGARSVSVLSFAQAAGLLPTTPSLTAYRQSYTSSRITYLPLPPPPGPNIAAIVGGAIGGAAFLFLLLVAGLYTLSRYRRNAAAPVDISSPFALMFTDIQSSTTLWADLPETMSRALTVHHAIIRTLIAKHNGYEVKTVGDCFMIAFKSATDAIALAKDLQVRFLEYDWGSSAIDTAYTEMDWDLYAKDPVEYPKTSLSAFLPAEEYKRLWNGLRVRVGIHFDQGEIVLDPVSERYDYYGTVANVAARVEAAAHGGQVVVTEEVLKALPHTELCVSLGPINLRGVPKPILLQQLTCVPGRVYPPLRAASAEMEQSISWQDHTPCESKAKETDSNAVSSAYTGTDAPGKQMVSAVLTVLFAPFTQDLRREQLKHLCTKWQIGVGGKAKSDPNTFMIEQLVSRLGPIVQAKVKKIIPVLNHNEAAAVSVRSSISDGL